jgi:hypothetical protein
MIAREVESSQADFIPLENKEVRMLNDTGDNLKKIKSVRVN